LLSQGGERQRQVIEGLIDQARSRISLIGVFHPLVTAFLEEARSANANFDINSPEKQERRRFCRAASASNFAIVHHMRESSTRSPLIKTSSRFVPFAGERQDRRIRRAERRQIRREGRMERRAARREGRAMRREIRQGM
jgi:hypothetical protein